MTRRFLALLVVIMVVGGLLGLVMTASNAQEFGSNWTATFFNTANLSGPVVATQVGLPGVNFNWGSGSPVAGAVNADNFSARFTSTQNFTAGVYQFIVSADDGVRVIVDGQTVLDEFVARPLTTNTFQLTLTEGTHNLVVEYFEELDQASVSVQWLLQTFAATAGPSPTPAPTSTPPATGLPAVAPGALSATVIRAPVLNARDLPGLQGAVLTRLFRGQTFQVIGRDERARWFLLQLSGFQGWAFGFYLHFNTNEFNAPVVGPFAVRDIPVAISGDVAMSLANMKLRQFPTVFSEQIGRIPWGGVMPIIGRTAGGDWWQVVWKDTPGWVASGYLRVIEGDIQNVPIVR